MAETTCAPHCDAGIIALHAHEAKIWSDIFTVFLVVLAIAGVVALILLWRRRRAIARALDQGTVDVLAAGVRASRKVGRYRQRIVDRANDH